MFVKMRMRVKIASDTQFSDDSLSARPSKLLTCKEPTTKQLFSMCLCPEKQVSGKLQIVGLKREAQADHQIKLLLLSFLVVRFLS